MDGRNEAPSLVRGEVLLTAMDNARRERDRISERYSEVSAARPTTELGKKVRRSELRRLKKELEKAQTALVLAEGEYDDWLDAVRRIAGE